MCTTCNCLLTPSHDGVCRNALLNLGFPLSEIPPIFESGLRSSKFEPKYNQVLHHKSGADPKYRLVDIPRADKKLIFELNQEKLEAANDGVIRSAARWLDIDSYRMPPPSVTFSRTTRKTSPGDIKMDTRDLGASNKEQEDMEEDIIPEGWTVSSPTPDKYNFETCSNDIIMQALNTSG